MRVLKECGWTASDMDSKGIIGNVDWESEKKEEEIKRKEEEPIQLCSAGRPYSMWR